jgi:signal transduction histidine kinase
VAAEQAVSRPLRRRVRGAILLATAGALVVFAVPMAVVVRSVYLQQAEAELEREAQRVLAQLPDQQALSGARLPDPIDAYVRLAAYDVDGRRVGGSGPSLSPLAALTATRGSGETAREGDDLATFVPAADEGTKGAIRAALPSATLSARYYRAWALMGVLAVGVLVLAWWAAGRLARRLSLPIEELAGSAEALGRGGFALHVPRSGVTEVDVVGSVLEESGRRLGDRFARERAFSADASHQLRTPITALRLTLEGAAADPGVDPDKLTREALTQVDRLESTVEDLLALARDLPGPAGPVWVADVVRTLEPLYGDPLRAQGRDLVVDVHGPVPAADFPETALRQVLDVLVDNALVHGEGIVTVRVRSSGTGVAVDVADQGRLPEGDPDRMFRRRSPDARRTGIGLALARSLAEADGARLLAGTGPDGHTVLTLLMTEWAAVDPVGDPPTIAS